MDLADLDPTDYELQTDVDACLQQCGATMDQVRRWRRDGLLPDVLQRQTPYRGSEVLYPKGTCAQIAAARRLFKKRNRVDFVGFELWWEGYPVDEKYWRPVLYKDAKWIDWTIAKLRSLLAADSFATNEPTIQESLAAKPHSNIFLSRILKRVAGEDLATFFGVIVSMIEGALANLSYPEIDSKPEGDEYIMLRALAILGTETHSVLGKGLNLRGPLHSALQELTSVLSEFTYSDAARADVETIDIARSDARNALRIGLSLYDALSWIYGPRAFGLQFMAWMAKKRTPAFARSLTLGFVLLRRSKFDLLSPAKIAEMADKAEGVRDMSMQAKGLAEKGGRFAKLFSGRVLRRAFRDQVSLARQRQQIENRRDDDSA